MPDLRAFANFAGLVDYGRIMDEVLGSRRLDRKRLPMLLDGSPTSVQNPENFQSILAIRAWICSLTHTIEKVLAFEFQGFRAIYRNHCALRLAGHGHAVHPVYPVRIKHQLSLNFGVVKHGHLPVAN